MDRADVRRTAPAEAEPFLSLPVEIAFLIGRIPPATLKEAARLALRWNVSADQALIASGAMREEDYIKAVAAMAGLPFVNGGLQAAASARFPESVMSGLVRVRHNLAGISLVLAPSSQLIASLLRGRYAGAHGLALTTHAYTRELVFTRCNAFIANRAANSLPDRVPDASARDGLTHGQIGVLALTSGIAAFFATLSPSITFAGIAALSAPLFLAMTVLRLAAVREPAAIKADRLLLRAAPDDECPVYTIVVPLYRERRVARRLIRAIEAFDYPKAKLDIKLMLEEDDPETRAALEALDLPDRYEILVAPAGFPRTKPRALNIALDLARGEHLVIYDAEDVPDPLQLRLAAGLFALSEPDVACLQARLVIDNSADGLLPRFFTIEYAGLFDAVNPGLAAYGLPVPLGGTSCHFRTEALRAVGGWDAWNVTEDADLGLRLARSGLRVADLPSHTYEEAPLTIKAWIGQRSRWLKGWMQVCATHSRTPRLACREFGAFNALGALTMSFGTVATALGFPVFTLAFLATLWNGSLLEPQTPAELVQAAIALPLFGAGLLAMVVPPMVGLLRRRWFGLLPLVPLLPAYYLLMAVPAWRALVELIRSPFSWTKTEHGLAKSSRSGALIDATLTDSAGNPLPPPPGGG